MGYLTTFKLKTAPGFEGCINRLRLENESAEYCLTDTGDFSESGKWYEHEEDMKTFSSKWPGVLFTLSGAGEESGDIWTKYFRDGKMQKAKAVITVAPFDETLLR